MNLKEITIEITQQCPNQCIYCSSFSGPNKTTCLSTENIIEVVDDAVALGCKSISLSGGEPFLHPGLVQIVNHITKLGLRCYIYTSGIYIDHGDPCSIPVKILEELNGKVDKYVVNVEADNDVLYNKIMGTSFHGFTLMKQFIKEVVLIGGVVEAHFVPMKFNYYQIPYVVDMCKELGVSRISFLRFVAQGRGGENVELLMLDEKEMAEAKKLMNYCVSKNAIEVRLGIPFSNCSCRINCLTGTSKLNIRYDGNVYPCEAFKNDQLKQIINIPVDNIKEERLKIIYNNSKYLAEVRKNYQNYLDFNTCETCYAQYLSKINQ